MPLKFGPSPLSLLFVAFAGVLPACAAGEGVDDGEQFGTFGSPTTQSNPEEEEGDGDATSEGDGDEAPETGDGDGEDPTAGPVCGDGQLSADEACDGSNLDSQTCQTLGYGGGTLACAANCEFDTSGCMAGGSCGNGVIDGTEACDGANLDGNSCTSLGYGGGALGCNADCTLNISGCTNGASCGNGMIDNGEACDGAALNGQTCVSQGFSGGTLSCNANCTGFNTAGCSNGAACGNGVLEGAEVCDGANLNGQSCVSVGYAGGNLSCLADCSNYNPAGCNDGNCCYVNGGVGCQVALVEDCVCGLDSWCCAVEWDDTCVLEAINDCAAAC
jgi:hypothetical protein